jgi:hypothetical protein
VLERDREVEEQAGNEKEVGKPAPAYGRDDQAGNNEHRAQYWNTLIDRCAKVRKDGF